MTARLALLLALATACRVPERGPEPPVAWPDPWWDAAAMEWLSVPDVQLGGRCHVSGAYIENDGVDGWVVRIVGVGP